MMGKKKIFATTTKKDDEMVIKINPFEIERKIRKPIPPPSRFHKDKSKYTRKQKHKKNIEE